MPLIVGEDDAILRTLQALLDPDTPAERQAAVADYFSVDLPDFEGWRAALRAKAGGLFPATVRLTPDQAAFREVLRDADAAVVQGLQVGEDELAGAPRLALVQKFGIDTRNIDVTACERRGAAVRTLRRRVNVAVAEHAFALMLALAKKICLTDGRLDFARLRQAGFAPRMFDRRHTGSANWARVGGLATLQGATLGALGLGEIGREVATRARAFGMEVVYHQRNRLPDGIERESGARYCGFDELLARADTLSIHLPLDARTTGMIDRAAFARMKPGATIVNVARAAIVDREALIEALRSGRLGGAGFDVHHREPGEPDDPLLAFDNVVLTPHIAVASRRNGAADMEELVANLAAVVA